MTPSWWNSRMWTQRTDCKAILGFLTGWGLVSLAPTLVSLAPTLFKDQLLEEKLKTSSAYFRKGKDLKSINRVCILRN